MGVGDHQGLGSSRDFQDLEESNSRGLASSHDFVVGPAEDELEDMVATG